MITHRMKLFQLGLVLTFIAIGSILFYVGKGHDLILENKLITIGPVTYKAAPSIKLIIDDQKAIPVNSGFANKAFVVGASHSLKAQILDDAGAVIKVIEKKFKLSLHNSFLISMPALVANDPKWIKEI
ncbi:MAG: hypothetical protein ISR65_08805 [Bacteriovoracaceae bacterium]|nr:hypothetical protein [Bacteriovoracaceae bacterium]